MVNPSVYYFRPDEVNAQTEEVTFEEVAFGLEKAEYDDDEPEPDNYMEKASPGIRKVVTEEDVDNLTKATTCLVFLQQLLSLASDIRVPCKECQAPVEVTHKSVGSAIYLYWV